MTPEVNPGRADQGPEDYSYDLVHEVPPPATHAAPARPGRHGEGQVSTTAVDPESDYSYDLAHEIPPQHRVE